MNTALIYRPNNRKLIWIAFACAITIHLGAIAIAKNKANPVVLNWDGKTNDSVIGEFDPSPQPPDPDITLVPKIAANPDQEFTEESAVQTPIHPRKKTPVIPMRSTNIGSGQATPAGSVKSLTLYAPKPNYPYEARRGGITGSGVAQLTVNSGAGNVVEARMSQSTGNAILDNATVEALRRWRFKPEVAGSVNVPVTFTLTGVSY